MMEAVYKDRFDGYMAAFIVSGGLGGLALKEP